MAAAAPSSHAAPREPLLAVRSLAREGLEVEPFELAAGECVAVRGPSGAGKSLLLRAIADLDPNEGDLRLAGSTRAGMPAPRWRRQVGYVPAESGWWAPRVGEHFADEQASLPLLLRLGFTGDCLGWPVTRLSTGERQRLAFARALGAGARVLLLDEPTSALDGAAEARVESVLTAWLGDGGAALVVTHDDAQAARLARRRLLVERGRVQAVPA